MPFIGAVPAQKYISLAKQDFTTIAGTGYTLDQSVTNEVDIALFINHVRQEPTTAYTASGTTLTLTSATTTSDDMYCVFLGKATETINPPSGSVNTSQLVDGAVNNSKIASDAAIATTKLGAGAILQVVSATKTDTATNTSTTFSDITDLSVSITPSSTNSKILLIMSVSAGNSSGSAQYRFARGGTGIAVGDASSNRTQTTFSAGAEAGNRMYGFGSNFLDSPSTISATTYSIQWRVQNSPTTIYINRSPDDTDNESFPRGSSTITAMEIAG